MTSRARVHAALTKEPVDRVPVWMWYHPEIATALARELEIPVSRLADALGDDVRQTWVGNNYSMEGILHPEEGGMHTDAWGIEWIRIGAFNQVKRSPLDNAGPEQIRGYQFPYASTEHLLLPMARVNDGAGDYFIGCDISPCLLELLFRIRGMEQTLIDIAGNPETIEPLIGKAGDFAVHLATAVCKRFRLDWLWTGDDVGGQQAMIVSPERWREMVKPHLARIFAVGKSRGLPVAYHCCGTLRPIIPDLIEMGLDVLNPIQSNCPGMDAAELKREFGNRLAFMGGLDTQVLLPRGTAREVLKETRRLIEVMTADGGGYILAASHSVPPETPMENVFAMYEAAGITKEEIFDRAAGIREKVD